MVLTAFINMAFTASGHYFRFEVYTGSPMTNVSLHAPKNYRVTLIQIKSQWMGHLSLRRNLALVFQNTHDQNIKQLYTHAARPRTQSPTHPLPLSLSLHLVPIIYISAASCDSFRSNREKFNNNHTTCFFWRKLVDDFLFFRL